MLNNPRAKNSRGPVLLRFFNREKKEAEKKATDIVRSIENHGWPWSDGYFDLEGKKYYENRSGQSFSSFKDCFLSELTPIDWDFVNAHGGWIDFVSGLSNHPRPVSIEIITESFLEFKKIK